MAQQEQRTLWTPRVFGVDLRATWNEQGWPTVHPKGWRLRTIDMYEGEERWEGRRANEYDGLTTEELYDVVCADLFGRLRL